MSKPTRLELLVVPVAVCLLLFVAFGGTAFARSSSPGTHPHLSGSQYVTSSYGGAVVVIHGSGFLPSTTTLTNYIQASVFASTDSNANGFLQVAVDSHGSLSAILVACGIDVAHDLIEIGVEDLTTYLYANILYITAN